MKRVRSSVAVVVVASIMMLSACAGSSGSVKATDARVTDPPSTQPGSTTAVLTDGQVNIAPLQAEVDALLAMSPAEQEAKLAALDGQMERQLWKLSGLEADLGGAAAADAVFADHSQGIVAIARTSGNLPVVSSGLRRTATPSNPNLGEGMFGGIIVVTLGSSLASSNDLKDGESGSRSTDDKTMTATLARDNVQLDVDVKYESGGVTTKLKSLLKINPCPDATGHIEAKVSIDVSATKTGGSTGQNGTLELNITGEVNDDAKLVSSDADFRMQWADFVASKGSYVDVAGTFGDTKVTTAKLNRSGGADNPSLQTSAVGLAILFGMLMKTKILEEAEKGWQSGRCVTLQPTAVPGPTAMQPGATSTITAAPRSRVDGTPVGGSVAATLSAGGASVDPSGSKVPADATFTYTAPGEVDKTGTVSLEARSKRGVAKASIDFDTKRSAYTASGGTEVIYSGKVGDLSKPFTINGAGQGFNVVYSYTPTSTTGGTMSYTGSGSGITLKGSGSYTISGADPDPLTLTATAHGCVNVGSCRDTTDVITLTRASD